jgi:hypothetical protein
MQRLAAPVAPLYCTVRETLKCCTIGPLTAVTVSGYFPAGVPRFTGGEGRLLPPPQPAAHTTNANAKTAPTHAIGRHLKIMASERSNTNATQPWACQPPPSGRLLVSSRNAADGAVVVMVIVVIPPPLSIGGLNWQLLMAGKPVHENVMGPEKPFSAVTVSGRVPIPPGAAMVTELDAPVSENPGFTVIRVGTALDEV